MSKNNRLRCFQLLIALMLIASMATALLLFSKNRVYILPWDGCIEFNDQETVGEFDISPESKATLVAIRISGSGEGCFFLKELKTTLCLNSHRDEYVFFDWYGEKISVSYSGGISDSSDVTFCWTFMCPECDAGIL